MAEAPLGAVLPEAKLTGDDGAFVFSIRSGTPFQLVFFKDLHWVPQVTPALNGVETPQSFAVTMRTVEDYRASKERLSLRTKLNTLYEEFYREDGTEDEFTSLLYEMRQENLK